MLKYARSVPRSEEIVIAPATAQLVQLTISSELARRQHIPVPNMLPAAQIVVDAGRSFALAAEEEASRLSSDCARQVRALINDLDLSGSDLMSVSNALRSDQSVPLRTALRDACFQYNLIVMKILLSLNGQKIKIIKSCGEQLIAEIHSIPQTSGNMRTLVPLFKHFIEDLTQFCYRITDYYKEIKDKPTRVSVENALRIVKRTPTVISNILQDKQRRATLNTDRQLSDNIRKFVSSVKTILGVLRAVDVESATRYLELVLHASIAVAGETASNRRQSISAVCKKILRVRSELGKLFSVTSKTAQSWNTINHLTAEMSEQFSELNRVLSQTYKSSEHATEQSRPLLNLKSAAQRSAVPNDPELNRYIERFKQHANRLMDITEYAVQVSAEGDENIPILRKIAHDISVLGPKIIACALSVHAHPGENVTLAFMNAMCNEWSRMVTRLLALIDNLTNTGEFLRATEGHISKDMALSKQAFIDQDSSALTRAAKAMVNRAQRVFHVGQKELLRSTSAEFSERLEGALGELEHALPRIITLVQAAGENFDDINTQEELAAAAHDVARAVHTIKTIVCGDEKQPPGDQVATQTDATQRFASALRSESAFLDIGVQTYPENMANGADNPPDILLQFAMKDDSLDPDDIHKLVGASGVRKPPASINEAIISLADLITTALQGESPESAITVLAAHAGRIRDLSVQCHGLSENKSRLRTIDFLVREMDKLTPSVNDAARKTAQNTRDVVAIENLRWSGRHWADSVIVLGKAFDDFGLAPTLEHAVKVPSVRGLLNAAAAGDKEMVEAELDSLALRTRKQVDLAGYCSAACLNSTTAQQLDETATQLEDTLAELARTAREIEAGSDVADDVIMSQMEHLSEKWRELYGELCTLVVENQPDTIPSEGELGIPPSKVNTAIEQLVTAARAGDRSKVQVLGNSLSAMATKVRRVSKPIAERLDAYQREYITETNQELLELTPELLKYGLLVAADPHNNEFSAELDRLSQRWADQMIALSNALDAAAEEEGAVMVGVEEVEEVEGAPPPQGTRPRKNTYPQDLREPIEAVGYRLIRQGSLSETDEGELREIKSVTTKLCDCLQVLSSTHNDVNERYDMEDSIETVKAAVNSVLLGRPGTLPETVTEWLNSVSVIKGHLDTFLGPLLDIVSQPSNRDVFPSSPARVETLVTALRDVVQDMERAVELGLVSSERDRDDVTLVRVTMDHLEKVTPPLLDAVKVILARPDDPLQRTKFEAMKYQWATKLRLLTIALNDIVSPHLDFPGSYESRADASPMATVDALLSSVDGISESLSQQEFSGLASKHITRLLTHRDAKLPELDVAQFVAVRTETCFAVYLLNSAVEVTCANIGSVIPVLSRDLLDVSSVEFDGEKLAETTEEAIDAVRLISERVEGDEGQVREMKSSMGSLVQALSKINDTPSSSGSDFMGAVLNFKTCYTDWLCKVKALSGDTLFDTSIYEMSDDDATATDGAPPTLRVTTTEDEEVEEEEREVRCSTFRSDLSGSQTFDELHFSDNEGDSRTPEPTFVPAIISEEGEEVDEVEPKDWCGPLDLETSEDPRQSPVVRDVAAVVNEKAAALEAEGQGRRERTLSQSLQDLGEELAPWQMEQNDILLTTTKLLQQFLLITNSPDNRAQVIEVAMQISDTNQELCDTLRAVIPTCEHKGCTSDLEYCVATLPSVSRQIMITASLVPTDGPLSLVGPHIISMVACLTKVLRSSYHAHLSGMLPDLQWTGVDVSDDDSVVV